VERGASSVGAAIDLLPLLLYAGRCAANVFQPGPPRPHDRPRAVGELAFADDRDGGFSGRRRSCLAASDLRTPDAEAEKPPHMLGGSIVAKITVGTEHGTPIELYYEDHGVGKPVVLIHGWPLSARSWENQVPALIGAGYRVIAYDRRGFGSSSQPWDGYDYDTLAADLNTLMEELDLREATLVGFSMGGGEVARYIGTYGTGRLAGAVFASAVPPYLYKSADNPDGGLDDATIAGFEGGVKGDRIAFLEEFTKNFFTPGGANPVKSILPGGGPAVSEMQRIYARDIAAFASPKGTLDCIAAFGRTDFRGDLAKVTVPTLVIHGDADAVVPFEVSGKRTHAAIAGSQLVVVKGGPHGVNASHPEEFNAALLGFLKG